MNIVIIMFFMYFLCYVLYNDDFVLYDIFFFICYFYLDDILFFYNFQSLYQLFINCVEKLSFSKEYLIFFWYKISNFQFYDSLYLYIGNIDNW